MQTSDISICIDGNTKITDFPEMSYNKDDCNNILSTDTKTALSVDVDCDMSELSRLESIDTTNNNHAVLQFDVDEYIQMRHHRKKRINKKWMKKYGYKHLSNISYKFNETTRQYDITKNMVTYTSNNVERHVFPVTNMF